jgi:hypothetical protein
VLNNHAPGKHLDGGIDSAYAINELPESSLETKLNLVPKVAKETGNFINLWSTHHQLVLDTKRQPKATRYIMDAVDFFRIQYL